MIDRREFIRVAGIAIAGTLAGCAKNGEAGPTVQPIRTKVPGTATPTPTLTNTLEASATKTLTSTATETSTVTEVAPELDELSKFLETVSFDSATGLYEIDGRKFKVKIDVFGKDTCEEEVKITFVSADVCTATATNTVVKRKPTKTSVPKTQVPQNPTQPPFNPTNPPEKTSVPPTQVKPTAFKPNNPGSAPTPTVVNEQNYQPPTLIPATPVPATEVPNHPLPQPTSAPASPTPLF